MKGGKKTYILIFINYKIKGSDTTVKLITLEPENSVGFSNIQHCFRVPVLPIPTPNTVFGSQCYRFQHPTLFFGPSVTDSDIRHCFQVPLLSIPTSDTIFRSHCYQLHLVGCHKFRNAQCFYTFELYT